MVLLILIISSSVIAQTLNRRHIDHNLYAKAFYSCDILFYLGCTCIVAFWIIYLLCLFEYRFDTNFYATCGSSN